MYEFSVDDVEEYNDTIQDGTYPVMITEGILRPSKNNSTTHLAEFTYQIDGSSGQFEGFTIRDYFIIKHAEERWEKKGKSDLRGLLILLGLKSFRDPSELVGQRFTIKTKINKEGYPNVYDRIGAPKRRENNNPVAKEDRIPF